MEAPFLNFAGECAFYQRGQGRCTRGATCTFLHVEQTEGIARYGYHASVPPRSRALHATSWPCDYSPVAPSSWPQSNAHATSSRTETEDAIALEETTIPEKAWVRRIKGVNVTFGPGATIATIALPWHFSAVRFTHLAEEFHKSDIAEYLHHELGIQVPEERIATLPVCGGKGAADVTMDEADFARKLVDALNDDKTVEFRAEEVIPHHHRSARFGSISGNKVSCSWHKPSWTATLSFPSAEAAQQVYNGFAIREYKLAPNVTGMPSRPEADDGPSPSAWKVKLHHVPSSINRVDVLESIPSMLRPKLITQSCRSYTARLEDSAKTILKSLMNIGPLDHNSITTRTESQRYKLIARFVDAKHATKAVQELNKHPLPFHAHGKLTVQRIYTVRIRVPGHVYAAASQDIKALYSAWKGHNIFATIGPENKGFRTIRIEGICPDRVAEAQAAIERIVAGEQLTEDDEKLWSASFATNAWAYNEMRFIERQIGVLILCDRQQRSLNMLGPRAVFREARLAIQKLCHQDPRAEYSISLDPADREALTWLLNGGFQHIGRIVGRDKLALDIVDQPRRLIISGSEADLQVAQEIWYNRHQIPEPESSLGPEDCSLCGFQAEYPVNTRCQHLYCATCFEDMCFCGASSPVRTPAVRCYGDAGKCQQILTLSDIQENLSSSALERIFERIFVTFVSQNSDMYRYCPTHSCEQVYRVEERKDGAEPVAEFEFNCPQCMVAICSRCHVSHETLHCPLHDDAEEDSL
ncbi:Zinc finger, C6HC-type [Akanthomyces lecanii RCEF 1005]|uniref:Zinc finger, C6HC-type n=1 Tax=Akanthomyces lecanii RCEF 1005 TaxID=1081108 RepID=A0A167SD33_CORDF|nr:Zinc finger, C6HC-type [Akanthomyces lecanii RCEF 1005]